MAALPPAHSQIACHPGGGSDPRPETPSSSQSRQLSPLIGPLDAATIGGKRVAIPLATGGRSGRESGNPGDSAPGLRTTRGARLHARPAVSEARAAAWVEPPPCVLQAGGWTALS